MHTVLLFDVDGTLVDSGGAGRIAMERAFEAVTGDARACSTFSFAGMTDRAIARRGLQAVGHTTEESDLDAVIEAYLAALAEELPRAKSFRVLPGVAATVSSLGAPRVAVGLGTGNVKQGARLKLTRAGLDAHFGFGGFGCDHESRAELISIGAQRGAAALGVPRASCRVVVIGDTPLDVVAARDAGAECLGVGTGSFSPSSLIAAGALHAVETLEDPSARAFLCDAG